MRTLDSLPGRPAREIFEALGFDRDGAVAATDRFLNELDERNRQAPPVPIPTPTRPCASSLPPARS